jgi:hypothetical protein
VSGRNPDLPILDELGAEFEALVGAAYATGARPAGADGARPRRAGARVQPDRPSDRHTERRRAPLAAPRRSRERGAQARRIGRRAAIVLVLVCLVGGVAFAALRGGDGPGEHGHTSPALLGRDAGGAWSFSVYRDGGRLCTVFVPRGGELSGSCGAAPGRGRLRAGSAIASGRRYVFGVGGASVERASVALSSGATHLGSDGLTGAAPVRRPVDVEAASDAGLPAGDGWFVLDLGPVKSGGQSAAPAVVTPLTRQGDRVGPPYVDCSLGVLAPACVQRIESAARG